MILYKLTKNKVQISAYLQTRISSSRTIHKLFFHSIIINYDGIDYFNEIYKINNDKLIVE